MKKAVIFDLDGTLVDTIEDVAAAMNDVLAARGFPVHAAETYRTLVGDGMSSLVRAALPFDKRDDKTHREAVDAMMGAYGRVPVRFSLVYPGIPRLLARLEADGVPFAVCSNKPDALVALTLRGTLPRTRFAAVRGERPGTPRKPDPAIALAVAAELGVEPGNVAFVGDSDIDVLTARNAGMLPIAVTWGYRDRASLEAARPKLVATTAETLERALAEWYTAL